MVTKHDPAMRRHEVASVLQALRRSRAGGIERDDARRDPATVEPIREQIDARRGYDQPGRVDRFTAVQGDAAEGGSADESYRAPDEPLPDSFRAHEAAVSGSCSVFTPGNRRRRRILHRHRRSSLAPYSRHSRATMSRAPRPKVK